MLLHVSPIPFLRYTTFNAHTRTTTLEKLRSKDVATDAGEVSICYAYALIESARQWAEPSKLVSDSLQRHHVKSSPFVFEHGTQIKVTL